MNHRDLERKLRTRLRDEQVPEADEAAERARTLIRSVYQNRERTDSHRESWRRRALQLAVVIGLVAVVVSPAGAAVRDWVNKTVSLGQENAMPVLTRLPTEGSLLVESGNGSWVVHQDGSKRRLGQFEDLAWSPRGLFVAATTRHQLVALDPEGEVRWTLSKKGFVHNPSWNTPDGFRVAYLEGDSLRVVAGDGSGDRLLARGVAPLTPAWKPGPAYLLAYAVPNGSVKVMAADSGKTAFVIRPSDSSQGNQPLALQWSADGRQLLVVRPSGVEVYDAHGRSRWGRSAPGRSTITAGALSPKGESVALSTNSASGGRSEVVLVAPDIRPRNLFSGPGRFGDLTWSPDGHWILLGWQSADQWLFLNPDRPGRIVAVSDIARQFGPGTRRSARAFPDVAGWCCTR